jgi:hypothetical protein
VLAPSVARWALAHGFARLAIDGTFGQGEPAIDRVRRNLAASSSTERRLFRRSNAALSAANDRSSGTGVKNP